MEGTALKISTQVKVQLLTQVKMKISSQQSDQMYVVNKVLKIESHFKINLKIIIVKSLLLNLSFFNEKPNRVT